LVVTDWTSGHSLEIAACIARTILAILPWACTLLQSPPDFEQPSRFPVRSQSEFRVLPADAFLEVLCPYNVSPYTEAALLMRFASPHRLHPQVLSTSRRFHLPCTCWPYFVPDPFMGFRPSELCSPRAVERRLQRRYPHAVKQTRLNHSRCLPPAEAFGIHRICRLQRPAETGCRFRLTPASFVTLPKQTFKTNRARSFTSPPKRLRFQPHLPATSSICRNISIQTRKTPPKPPVPKHDQPDD
jgi:hypothetical protein